MKRQKRAFFKKFLLPAFLAFTLALSACTPSTNSNSTPSSSINASGVNNNIILKHQDAHEFLAVPANKQSIVQISNKFLSNFSSFFDIRKVKTASEELSSNNASGNFFNFRSVIGVKKGVPKAEPPKDEKPASETPASSGAAAEATPAASAGGETGTATPPSTDTPTPVPKEAEDVVVKGLQSNLTASTKLQYLVEKLSSSTTAGTESDFTKLETNLTQKQTAVESNLKAIEAKLSGFKNSVQSDIAKIERTMKEVAAKSKTLPNVIKSLLTDAESFVSAIMVTTRTEKAVSHKLSSTTGTQLFNFVNKVKTALANKNFSTANDPQTYQSFKSAYTESLNLFNQISQSLDSKSAKLMGHLKEIVNYLNSYKILQDYLNDSAKVNTNLSLGFILASDSQKSTEPKLENFKIPISNYIQAANAFISNPVGLKFFDSTNLSFSGIIYDSGSSLIGTAIKSLSNDLQKFKDNGKTLLFNLNLLGNDPSSITKFEQILNAPVKDDYQRVNKAFLSPQKGIETIMRSFQFKAEEVQKYYQLNFAHYFDLHSNNSIAKTMSDLEALVNSYNTTQTDTSKKIVNFTGVKQAWKKIADFFKKSVAYSNEILGIGNDSKTANNFVGWSAILKKLQSLDELGNFNVFNLLEFGKNIQKLTTSFNTAISNDKLQQTSFSNLMGYTSPLNHAGKGGLYESLSSFQAELTSKGVNNDSLKNKFKELFVSVNDSTSLVGKLVQGFPVTRNGVGVETNSAEKTRLSYFIQLDSDFLYRLYYFSTQVLKLFPPNDGYNSAPQTLNSWLQIAVS